MTLLWPPSHELQKLAPCEAHVWAVPLDGSHSVKELAATLSVEEQQRAERFRLDQPRLQFMAGRVALRTILGRYLGVSGADIELVDDAHGKPRLATGAPAQVFFNVAHSARLALVGATIGCEVGIDVERRREVSHWQEIADRYFHDAEVRAILASPPSDRAAAFLQCWTAKEAVLKALGVGLRGSLAAFHVPVTAHDGQWIEAMDQQVGWPTRVWLRSLSADADYLAAIAIVGESCCVRCFTFPWSYAQLTPS
jgi:4'-phosphopantetheinyl transferase